MITATFGPVAELNPGRYMLAGLIPTTHVAVDFRAAWAARYRWTEQRMVDAQAGVPSEGIPASERPR
jgi:hypothetical protein